MFLTFICLVCYFCLQQLTLQIKLLGLSEGCGISEVFLCGIEPIHAQVDGYLTGEMYNFSLHEAALALL